MVILLNEDMFEVRINSLLADYDRETLTNLYQPIIGYSALAVYFTLWSEANIQKVLSFSSHEQLLTRMKMPAGYFVEARKLLEAVGLLKTKLEKASHANIYHYELFSPKFPKGFFADTLLYGMLIQALGESDAERLKKVYEIEAAEEEGEDISSSFNDVFHPDFQDPSFLKAANSKNKTVGRDKGKITTEFSYENFFKCLGEISQISERAISKKEMKEIERLASLYGVDEESVANVVSNAYDSSKDKGERLDFDLINDSLKNEANYAFINKKNKRSNNKVNGDTQLANKINLFESVTPIKFLQYLQGGTKVANSDLRIIETLSKDYALNNSVINVIIDYVLDMNKNVLSGPFAEKIAASFNREKIETAYDAMNYCNEVLNAPSKKGRKSKAKDKNNDEISLENRENNSKDSKEISKDEWNSLFEEEQEDKIEDGKNDNELPF